MKKAIALMFLATAMAAQQRPIDRGIDKWQGTEVDCGGIHTSDCQCWDEDASDCDGDEICHWCPGAWRQTEPDEVAGDLSAPPDGGVPLDLSADDDDSTTISFSTNTTTWTVLPDDFPSILIKPDCGVTVNRNHSIADMFAELVRLIATGKPLCGPKQSVCEAACPDGKTCGCVEPNTGTL